MNNKLSWKTINTAKIIKLIFLAVIIAAGVMLLESNYKKSEEVLMRELKAAESRKDELQLRLNSALETIAPIEESIEPLKEEIDNLRKIVMLEKSIGSARVSGDKNQISWQGNTGAALSEGNIAPRPLPSFTAEERLIEPRLAGPYEEKNFIRLKNYIKEIEERNAQLKERSERLDKLLNDKEDELSGLNTYNLALKEELAVKEKEKTELSREYMQLEEFKRGAEKEMARLNSRSSGKDNEISVLNERINELGLSRQSLQQEIEKLGGLIKIKESEISESRREIASLKDRIAEALREKETLLSELKDKEKVIARLSVELASAEDLQQNSIKQFIEFQQNNIALRQKIMDFAKELELLKLEKSFRN